MTTDSRLGLSVTAPLGCQFRVSRTAAEAHFKPRKKPATGVLEPLRFQEGLRRQLAHQLYKTDRGYTFALWPRFCPAVNEIALFYLERLSCAVKAAREGRC